MNHVTLVCMRFQSVEKISRYYFLIIGLWVICIITRLKYNGLVYGFDYGLYQPDGMFYSQTTLELLGSSKSIAIAEVLNWYKENAYKFASIDLTSFYDTTSNSWLVTKYRILYPLISLPFVYLFGLSGMLVVPAISLLLFFLMVQKIAILEKTPRVGALIVLALSTSPTLLRWTTVNYPDALLLSLFALFTYLFYRSNGIWSYRILVLLSVLIFLTTFTKQTLPIWMCIALYFFTTKKGLVGAVILLSSVTFALPSLYSFPFIQYFNSKKAGSIPGSLLDFISNSVWVNLVEFGQLVVLDRSLLLILIGVFYCAIKSADKQFGQVFIWTLIGCLLVNSLVGVPGVNFRYLLPVLPSAMLVVLKSNLSTALENSLLKFKFKN